MATVERTEARVIRINAPEYFEDPHFAEVLNTQSMGIATWHHGGPVGEYSDVFLVIDGGECNDFDRLPAWIADDVLRLVGMTGGNHAVVWITNLPQDAPAPPEAPGG